MCRKKCSLSNCSRQSALRASGNACTNFFPSGSSTTHPRGGAAKVRNSCALENESYGTELFVGVGGNLEYVLLSAAGVEIFQQADDLARLSLRQRFDGRGRGARRQVGKFVARNQIMKAIDQCQQFRRAIVARPGQRV